MKKIVLGLFILLTSFVLIFTGVNTKAVSIPSMIDGAQIRTTGNQGLKFSATIDSLEGVTEHGFFVALGEHTKDAIETAVESSATSVGGKKLKKIVVSGSELTFHGVVYNIPAKSYEQDITALAYAYDGSSYTFAAASVTRNILDVATAAVADPEYEPSEFIDRICNTSTFVLNGGSFADTSSFTIGAYNSGSSGTSGITLCTKASQSSGSGKFWYKVSLKRTSFNKNIFTIVERVTSGNTLDGDKDYDYVIAAYTSSDTSLLTAASSKTYFYIPGFSAGVVVKTNNNYEELLGTKLFLEPDEVLPRATKAYYDFGGWYTESDFSGVVQTNKEGEIAQTYYAKFTPTTYLLSFDLQGGKCDDETSLDNVSFNIEDDAIALPIASRMTRTDYTFVEWNTRADGTGDAITSIPAGSHANITAYAIWVADAPVDVELSSADSAALALITPTKFVKSSFTAGRFNIGGNTYDAGTDAFASVAAALSAAVDNDVIYVFAGTYSDNLTISNNGITLFGANGFMELRHDSSFTSSAPTSSIISGTMNVTSGVSNFTLRGFEIKGQVTLAGVNTANISNVVFNTGSVDGALQITSSSSSITLDKIYQLGSGARFVYVKANVSEFTMINSATLDAAVVSSASSKNLDFVRFGASYESQVSGTITIRNNYVRSSQSGFMFRNAKCNATTTSFTIENNYFYKSSGAIYLGANSYAPASGTTVDYTITQNTFYDCGNKTQDMDVIVVCTAAKTNVQIHNNAFIDSFKTGTGSKTDYVIKVRNAAGIINCSDNYFEGETGPISNVLNATGVSQLDTSASTTTPNTYEPYQVVEISENYYIYGVNLTTSGD